MVDIPGYEHLKIIHESAGSLVFRALRSRDGNPVVLKVLKEGKLYPSSLASYKHEYTIIRSLSLDCAIKAYELLPFRDTLVIVLEDFGGEALGRFMTGKRFTLDALLTIAIGVVEAIGKIHTAGITHKDINPSNILIHPDTGRIKIIDFGISTALSFQDPLQKSPNVLQGTLDYMSPEQTGRMKRAVDYRSDFYSLGATLYEMLCRRKPFDADDSLDLVYAHIARMPEPPAARDPKIPESVSNIIMKLLTKNAEDRYQSSQGIQRDLERCLNQFKVRGRVEPFELAQFDISEKFQIPPGIYGREREILDIQDEFRWLLRGERGILLVSGNPGIGKTSVVREAYSRFASEEGRRCAFRFISGKFDRFQRDIPYSAVVKAFRELVRQLLSERDDQLLRWREKLLDALGPNARVIIDVIPELELIIGPQPKVAALGPVETKNRFNLVFQNFIRSLCPEEKPLTIFLDDIQWADSSSLKLIELMAGDQGLRYLLLVLAYRDTETTNNAALLHAIRSLDKHGVRVEELHLSPFDEDQVCKMIGRWLGSEEGRVKALSDFIFSKTGGNPFFAENYLTSLHAQKMLVLDPVDGCWRWDLEKFGELGITSDVVGLLAARIRQFRPETLKVLQQAACVGTQFEVSTLAWVCDMTPVDTAASLQEAVAEGLVVPVKHSDDLLPGDPRRAAEEPPDTYCFIHDRIQQAAYSLIDGKQRPVVHRQVGKHFLETAGPGGELERIFDIVNQLNLGRDLIEDRVGRDELAHLNLKAGKRAMSSAAFEPALNYFKIGIGLLGEKGWERQYDDALALHIEATEAAYLCAEYTLMEELISSVVDKAGTLLDKAKIREIQIDAFKSQYRLQDALQTAKPELDRLEVRLPAKTNMAHILLEYVKTRFTLLNKPTEGLIDVSEMRDPKKLASLQIMMRVSSAAYFSDPKLFPLIVMKAVQFSAKYGNAGESAFMYAVYGLILCGVMGDTPGGYKFGQLALRVLERFDTGALKARTFFMVYGFILHWKRHVRETLAPLAEAFRSGQETGDFEYASFSGLIYALCSLFSGRPLPEIEEEMVSHKGTLVRLKHEPSIHMHDIYHQTTLNLMGRSENPVDLVGEYYDEGRMQPLHVEAKDRTTLFNLYYFKLYLSYLFSETSETVELSALAEKYLDGVIGTPAVPLFHFYDALARLAVYEQSEEEKRRKILKKVASNQRKMKKWARHAPMNYLHKYYLVEAERNHVLGLGKMASRFYDLAIQHSKKNAFTNEEALGNELAGIFYLKRENEDIAGIYLKEARRCYARWGAKAKVEHLEKHYGDAVPGLLERASNQQESPTISSSTTVSEPKQSLDLAAVMKAGQAISSEIVMGDLLKQLMQIIVSIAGAEKGFLVLDTEGQLKVEASLLPNQAEIEVLQSTPLEACRDLSLDIVRFVFRTSEALVLRDSSDTKQFEGDPYILKAAPKSILCMPVRQKDTTVGVLYLENNLTTSAFSEERIQTLRIMLSQAAISIENARLYDNLKQEIGYRKQVQDDLLHLATAIEQAAEGIIITEKDGLVRYANPAFERITGYNQSEIVGSPVTLLKSDSKEENFCENLTRCITSGEVWAGRGIIKKKNGSKCYIEATLSPVRDQEQRVTSLVAVSRDVTREIKMERELRQGQKLEAIGTLAGGIAHDFNNILAAIIGYTELSLMSLPEDSTAGRQLDEVLKAGNRAKELVNQILSFSRQSDHKMQPVEPATITKEALKLMRATLPATIEIHTRIEAEGIVVMADPTQLHQVLMNLCTNAAHAMRKGGGSLDVSLVREMVSPNKTLVNPNLTPGPYVKLTVKDTGHGIPPSLMGRIFEPFFTTKEPGEGTGMGLAVVHGIVQAHGGTISAKSDPAKGTTFEILLPTVVREIVDQKQIDRAAIPSGRGCILLVDDEEVIVEVGQEILTRLGYEVVATSSSLDALETFKADPAGFDLIITDQIMPKMTGIELARSCTSIRPDIPMILCSGYNAVVSKKDADVSGIREFIVKPFTMGTMAETIRRVLENQKDQSGFAK